MKGDIRQALTGKCRWFDVIETEGMSTPISFKNNRLYSIRERQNSGFGVRVNVNKRTGFSYTNRMDTIDTIGDVIETALAIAEKGDIEEFQLPADSVQDSFEPFCEDMSFHLDDEIRKGNNVINGMRERFPDIRVDVTINGASGRKSILNSEGFEGSYRFSYYAASINGKLVMKNGSMIEVWESLTDLKPVDIQKLADAIIDKLERAVVVKQLQSGRVPVVFTPKAFAQLLSILRSGFSAKAVFRGISPFGDKRGERIFNSKFGISDEPRLRGSVYSFPFDDEGVAARQKSLIENGIVMQFVSDLKFAHKLGLESSGNASRSHSSLPVPSFSNVVVSRGEVPVNDLFSVIQSGLLVDQFIGLGQSNTLTGQFSANLDLAFLIEGGEIVGRIKDSMIADNLFELLDSDLELSSEAEQIGSSLVPYVYFPSVHYTC